MRWIALLPALLPALLAAASALAALGWSRVHKPRERLRALERRLLAGGRLLSPAESSKARRETSRVSPDARKAPAHPLDRGQTHLLAAGAVDDVDVVGVGGSLLGAIARFLVRLLLLLTGASMLMVDSTEPNPPPIAADMSAASDLATKVQSVCPEEAEEDKAAALDLDAELEDRETSPPAVRGVFFDGLQFYKTLTTVGRGAVQSAMDAAMTRATRTLTAKRPLPPPATRPDSIAFIRERYPDFICLLPTATHPARSSSHVYARRPHSDSFPPRLDLLSALRLAAPASRPPHKSDPGAKDVEERAAASSEQVRRTAALASPKQLNSGFLRAA